MGTTLEGARTSVQLWSNDPRKNYFEVVERWMNRTEVFNTYSSGLLRGGRTSGMHYVSDSANSDPLRARQRLSLSYTPQVRAQIAVPAGIFPTATPVEPMFGMSGGGRERFTEASNKIPAAILKEFWK